jgi:hypothetical protein
VFDVKHPFPLPPHLDSVLRGHGGLRVAGQPPAPGTASEASAAADAARATEGRAPTSGARPRGGLGDPQAKDREGSR